MTDLKWRVELHLVEIEPFGNGLAHADDLEIHILTTSNSKVLATNWLNIFKAMIEPALEKAMEGKKDT